MQPTQPGSSKTGCCVARTFSVGDIVRLSEAFSGGIQSQNRRIHDKLAGRMSILAPTITEPLQGENFTVTSAEAFLAFDCRPLFRWVSCGSNYSYNLRVFYAAFCCLHAISTFGALLYTLWTFCSCCGRKIARKNRKLTLRVFTSFSLAAFTCTFLQLNQARCVYCSGSLCVRFRRRSLTRPRKSWMIP